jgi:hypothetical protein
VVTLLTGIICSQIECMNIYIDRLREIIHIIVRCMESAFSCNKDKYDR